MILLILFFFFFQAEDGIRDFRVTGVQTCALPICEGARPSPAEVVSFIDAYRDQFGVEPICRTLQVAPSTYYACKARPPSARAVADEGLKDEVARVYKQNFEVYGAEKIWRQLAREGIRVGRDRV